MRFAGYVLLVLISFICMVHGQTTMSTDQRVLTGPEWRLLSLGPAGSEVGVVAGTKVTLTFGEDGRASVDLAVDQAPASYTVHAAFAGDGMHLGSEATSSFEIRR